MNASRPRVYIKLFFLAVILTVGISGVIMASAATIDGWVKTDEDPFYNPVEGATVVFLDGTGTPVDSYITEGGAGDPGHFEITVPIGTYEVYVYPPDYSHTSGYYMEEFQVFGDQTIGDWYIHYYVSSISFSGTVYDATSLAGLPSCGVYLFDNEFFYFDETDGNGDYSITCPEAATYEFEVSATGTNHDYYYPTLDVSDGGSKDIVLTADSPSTPITGTVTDSIHSTVYPDFWVFYTPDGTEEDRFGPYAAQTDASGDYSLYVHPNILYDITIIPPEYLAAYEKTEDDYLSLSAVESDVKDFEIDNPFPVSITVDDGTDIDTIHMADHNSGLDDGNYITLSTGDITVDLPDPMDVDYSGPRTAENEYEGNMVNVYSAFETRSILSPINTWELYYAPATVDVTFHGDDRLEGKAVDVRLLNPSYNEVMDAITDAKNGDTETLKNIIANEIQKVETTLDADGYLLDAAQFTINDPGDYTVIITYEIEGPNPYELYIYSVAPVEVLDYEITVTLEDPLDPSDFDVQMWVNFVDPPAGTEFSYACVLVKEDAYSVYSDVETDGTIDGTTTYVQHQGADPKDPYLVASNGELLGIPYSNYMDLLDYDFLNDELGNIYQFNQYSMGSFLEKPDTVDVLLSPGTDDTFQGSYVLTVIVWEHDTGNRIVGFHQETITLGQAVTITDVSTDLPTYYANIVPISYTVTSASGLAGATVEFSATIDGVLIPESDTVLTPTINEGANVLEYEWDTLLDVPKAYLGGGTAIVTLVVKDAGDNVLATTTYEFSIEATFKGAVTFYRITPLNDQWSDADAAEKAYLTFYYISKLNALWSDL